MSCEYKEEGDLSEYGYEPDPNISIRADGSEDGNWNAWATPHYVKQEGFEELGRIPYAPPTLSLDKKGNQGVIPPGHPKSER